MKTKNIHVHNKGKQRKQSKKQKQQRDFKSMRIKGLKTAMTSNFPGCHNKPQNNSLFLIRLVLNLIFL